MIYWQKKILKEIDKYFLGENQTLNKSSKALVVRKSPISDYFYPHDRRNVPVGNYKDIEDLLREGRLNRTIISTNMNRGNY